MDFHWIDYSIIAVYLIGVTWIGTRIAGRPQSSLDYFLGGRTLPWWAVGFSVVASETSTLTFISVPGLAYQGNLHFLQLALGYFVGRCLVSLFFIPAYYRGDLETAYDFIGKRFGLPLRRLTSSVFLITRFLASGVRLFASAIPIHLITGLSYPASILLVGLFTLIYTSIGGLKAVVAMDVVQMFIYLAGAGVAMVLIVNHLPRGWQDVAHFSTASGAAKLSVMNPYAGGGGLTGWLTSPYTLSGSLLGGTFLTMASHGTDQLLVQRLLACRTARESQRALLLDATVIVFQFGFFLTLGLCLFAFYGGASVQALGLTRSDEVLPKFIVEQLPTGLAGLVVAGVLASAMGTLSSAISALASSTYLDLFRLSRATRRFSPAEEMRWSRILTLGWGVALIGGAMLFTDTRHPVVELGLRIASVTYGSLLGIFFLGLLSRRPTASDAAAGLLAGIASMALVLLFTRVDYTWHTLLGCLVTVGASHAWNRLRS